jgi:hypothetical protein
MAPLMLMASHFPLPQGSKFKVSKIVWGARHEHPNCAHEVEAGCSCVTNLFLIPARMTAETSKNIILAVLSFLKLCQRRFLLEEL